MSSIPAVRLRRGTLPAWRARSVASPAWRGRLLDRPDLVALLVIGATWPPFVVLHAAMTPSAGIETPRLATQTLVTLAAVAFGAAPAWGLMSAAMMVPLALPAVRHVAVNSLHRRRNRAVATFLLAFLATWVLAGIATIPILALSRTALGTAAGWLLPVALVLGAGWELAPWKRQALAACGRALPLPPDGWRATAGCVRFGAAYGSACVRSCWALMAVMAVAGEAHVIATVAIGGLLVAERRVRTLRRRPVLPAAALLACALVTAAGLALGGGGTGAASLWFCLIPR